MEQFLHQLRRLEQLLAEEIEHSMPAGPQSALRGAIQEICAAIANEEEIRFKQPPVARSDFFRDAAGSAYMRIAEQIGRARSGVTYDRLLGVYDKCIIRVGERADWTSISAIISGTHSNVSANRPPSRTQWNTP